MPVSATQIDAQNIVFSLGGASTADLFAYNFVTGAVTSTYFPAPWLRFLTKSAAKLATALTPVQMQGRHALERLIAIGTLDGSSISTQAIVSGNTATLRLIASASAQVIVFIPHSMIGGFSAGQNVEVPTAATSDVTTDDLGLSLWTGSIAGGVVVNRLVAVQEDTGVLVLADNRYLAQGPCIGLYQLDSNGQPAVRATGPGPVGGTFGVGKELFVGINGLATDVPPAGPSATYSQFVGVSNAPSSISVTIGELVDI